MMICLGVLPLLNAFRVQVWLEDSGAAAAEVHPSGVLYLTLFNAGSLGAMGHQLGVASGALGVP